MYLHSVKQIGKWPDTRKPNQGKKPLRLMTTTCVNTCSETHMYREVKRTYLKNLILTTQYTVQIQIETLLDGLTKGFIDVVKRGSGRYLLSRSKKCMSGCER